MSQDEKIFLNMAGEFAVASELNRRRVLASVTYGSSKSADIFAVNRDMTRVVRVEVKTTGLRKWPIGTKATNLTPNSANVFWVLVLLPVAHNGLPIDHAQRGEHAPRFFVLSAEELYGVWTRQDRLWEERYRSHHGHAFRGLKVPNVSLEGVEQYEGQWQKIVSRLESNVA